MFIRYSMVNTNITTLNDNVWQQKRFSKVFFEGGALNLICTNNTQPYLDVDKLHRSENGTCHKGST